MAHYPEYNQAATTLYAHAHSHPQAQAPPEQYYPDPHLLPGTGTATGTANHFQPSHATLNHALHPRQHLYGGEAGAMPPPANVGPSMSAAHPSTPGAGGTIMSPGMMQQQQQQHQQQQQQQYRQPYQTQMRNSGLDAFLDSLVHIPDGS